MTSPSDASETVDLLQWLDEVVILHLAVWTADGLAVLAKEREGTARIQDMIIAILARQSLGTAWYGGEDIIRIHGSNDEGTAKPWCFTRHTARNLRLATLQAFHADSIQVLHTVIIQNLHISVVALRRQEECSVD